MMTVNERLAVHRQVKARNADRIQGGFLKLQMLARNVRVVVEKLDREFVISAQVHAPAWAADWDYWRTTSRRFAPTMEGALREFEAMVSDEQRYLELRR